MIVLHIVYIYIYLFIYLYVYIYIYIYIYINLLYIHILHQILSAKLGFVEQDSGFGRPFRNTGKVKSGNADNNILEIRIQSKTHFMNMFIFMRNSGTF